MTNLYMWRQNNSGGFFTLPALNILVEADSLCKARNTARDTWGIWFNDPDDCTCCGYRWADYGEDEVPVEESLKEVIAQLESGGRLELTETTWKGEPLPLYAVIRKEDD